MDLEKNHETGFRSGADQDMSFEDLVQLESNVKERALARISQAKRARSNSNLEKIMEGKPVAKMEFFHESPAKEGDEEEEEGEEDDQEDTVTKDLRKALFESIPEPYAHSTNFQRVTISDAGEEMDGDTKSALAKLKNCLALRDKWINAHPFPPQDVARTFSTTSEPSSPERPQRKGTASSLGGGGGSGAGSVTGEYRRRLPPTYDVFNAPLPHTIHHLRYKMIDGVVRVQVMPNQGESGSGGSSHVGMSLNSDSREEVGLSEGMAGMNVSSNGANSTETAAESSELAAAARIAESIKKQEDENIDWSKSMFPVFTFKEFVDDYITVRMLENILFFVIIYFCKCFYFCLFYFYLCFKPMLLILPFFFVTHALPKIFRSKKLCIPALCARTHTSASRCCPPSSTCTCC
jgi:hypothetical protein